MSSDLRLGDDVSDYDPSDSDEDYDENAKILLDRVRNRPGAESDSEESVFGVGTDDSDSEGVSDIAASDVEGQEDDELPDIRAWGKDRKKFYSTDYVDPDYGGFQGKDAQLAELEEEEARTLQQQLAQQLDDDDFALDWGAKPNKDESQIDEEVIKTDISKLSKRQKLQILQKESPEFFALIEDFNGKMKIVKEMLNPVIAMYKKGQIPNCLAMEFVTTQHELILNYCINIYMYLLLKSMRVSLENHPIIKRLYQYRQLLSQLEPVYQEIILLQIDMLLSADEKDDKSKDPAPKKLLNILNTLNVGTAKVKKSKSQADSAERPKKKVKLDPKIEEKLLKEEEINEEAVEDAAKRAITYQIAKNKGLTPYRKKEQRNPRVKHRNKFRKAKIRRRGAVREPRTEISRYGGESSGIKASVTKSVKIKS